MPETIQCSITGLMTAIVVAALFGALAAYDLMHGYVGVPM